MHDSEGMSDTDETHLIKVQPHNNVWLICKLMHSFQEVHVTNV